MVFSAIVTDAGIARWVLPVGIRGRRSSTEGGGVMSQATESLGFCRGVWTGETMTEVTRRATSRTDSSILRNLAELAERGTSRGDSDEGGGLTIVSRGLVSC